jgi:hypothetical protein
MSADEKGREVSVEGMERSGGARGVGGAGSGVEGAVDWVEGARLVEVQAREGRVELLVRWGGRGRGLSE